MTRLLLVSGKGGVGKTTVAAATAERAAAAGHRTLVVSVDRAHNLGDILGARLGPNPSAVASAPRLFAMEADGQTELSTHEALLRGYFARLLAWAGVAPTQADEVAVIPGLEEMLLLSRLATLVEGEAYDVLVVDLAPTASSLKLLSFPELMAGPLGRFARWERQFFRITRPAVTKLSSMPVPDDEFYEGFELLAERLRGLQRLLGDPRRCSVRLVATPERVVVEETRSAYTLLSLFGLAVDLVVMNRVLPSDLEGTSLGGWLAVQSRELARATEAFAGTPVRPLPFRPTEVLGLEALADLGRALYGEEDPAKPSTSAPPITFGRDGRSLTVALPHRDAAGVLDLQEQAGELIITLGGWRRRLLLPASFRGRAVSRAKLSDGALRVEFAAGDAVGAADREEPPPFTQTREDTTQ